MPVMTGIEATQLLRQFGYEGPIIGVTGNMMKEDVDQFISAGATEVMGKPLKLDQLNELLTGKLFFILLFYNYCYYLIIIFSNISTF